MGHILNRFFPRMKEREVKKQIDFSKQELFRFAMHPSFINSTPNLAELLHLYQYSVKLSVEEGIEKYKTELGIEPFKKHANINSIFCDDTDKNNHIYLLVSFNIYLANDEFCKYVVEMLTLKTISLNEYLDFYNQGLKCGLIATENKQ